MKRIARTAWEVNVSIVRFLWRVLVWCVLFLWHTACRIGRITLWLLVWPLGLWRSVHHGHKKRQRQLLSEIRKSQS